MTSQLSVKVRLQKNNGPAALLRTDAGDEFSFPADLVPTSCQIGGCFSLDFAAALNAQIPEHERRAMGRAILNAMLRT